MDKQAKEAKAMAKELPLQQKIDHIWTYYKWRFIIGISIVLMIIFSIYQAVTKPSYDLEVVIYSDTFVSDEAVENLEKYISQFVEDVDGDGEKTVDVIYMSTVGMDSNVEYQSGIQMKFIAELSSDMYYPYIIEGKFYELANMEGYVDAFEGFTPVPENEELSKIIDPAQNGDFYWTTRALYDRFKEKEDVVTKYNAAKELRSRVFGLND